jgi:DNA-binding response OmpR family regulator
MTFSFILEFLMMTPRILFVEDHPDTRRMVAVWLNHKDYQVETAASLSEGLELAKNQDFDLLIFDYQLGDGNGKELCRKVREFDAHTPIIFFSASHPKLQEEALVECGAQGFVLKPDFDALRSEISRTLRAA